MRQVSPKAGMLPILKVAEKHLVDDAEELKVESQCFRAEPPAADCNTPADHS